MTAAFDGYALGATLYMPVLHPKVEAILRGQVPAPAGSIVLCLEDALGQADVARGLAAVARHCTGPAFASTAKVFVRPRSREMAEDLAAQPGIDRFDGFVAPKVSPDTIQPWMEIARAAGLQIMPTLESADYFDPDAVRALRDVLTAYDRNRIAAIRIGGNDLLSTLALRRQRGLTAWEGPLAWTLSMMVSILVPAGYGLAAPVFDVIDDLETLGREVERDVAAGFVSKTAIHPLQVPVIERAFRVAPEELERAHAVLDAQAGAVFELGGVMCEPSTHRAWARRIVARNTFFGCGSA